jgi:hypothetical protein
MLMFRSLILRLDPLTLPNRLGRIAAENPICLTSSVKRRIQKFPLSSAPDDCVARQANWKEEDPWFMPGKSLHPEISCCPGALIVAQKRVLTAKI